MATQPLLSRIERVSLREVWPDEGKDFTPWLADHITELGEALGISLETEEAESPVRGRSLDILATDTSTGRSVIIENQLEYSDTDHLGRLLIYAAGKDADVVVWIVREFEDEHWQVLQWLNQRTGTDTRFFGVAVEAWRIAGSPPAPHFRVVVAPNDWRKRNVNNRGTVEPSERRRKNHEFRVGLEKRLAVESDLPLERGSGNPPWLAISGDDGLYYSVDFDSRIRLSFQMDGGRSGKSLEWCQSAFDRLEQDKEAIESDLGELTWIRQWGKKRGSYITSYYPERFFDLSECSWSEVHSWTIEQYRRFRDVFEPYREELLSAAKPS